MVALPFAETICFGFTKQASEIAFENAANKGLDVIFEQVTSQSSSTHFASSKYSCKFSAFNHTEIFCSPHT